MTFAVRFVTLLACGLVSIQWLQASARFIGHSSSSAPLAEFFRKDDVELIGLSPTDDSSFEQRHNRRLLSGAHVFDDDYDDEQDAAGVRASSTMQLLRGSSSSTKRSAWAPSEVRVDQLMQRLRTQLYQNRYKHSSPSVDSAVVAYRRRRSGPPSAAPSPVADLDQLRRLLQASPSGEHRPRKVVDDLETDIALLELMKTAGRPKTRPDVAMLRPETVGDVDYEEGDWSNVDEIETGNDAGVSMATAASKRATFVGPAEIRSPRDIHPVYLGMGQSAASAALNTYASLLADDKRRESSEHHLSSNPVRFIGKR